MTEAEFWWVHTITVEPLTGHDSYTETYGAPQDFEHCWVEDEVKIVRNDDGDEVTSSTTVYLSIADADQIPVGSKVSTHAGDGVVITNTSFDSGLLDLGLDHAVLTLT